MKIRYAMLVLLMLFAVPCVAANDIGIQSMLVGDKLLELTDNRQLTLRTGGNVSFASISPDGNYVVYLIDKQGGATETRVVRTSTGRSVTVMGMRFPIDRSSGDKWSGRAPIAWSPDSSMFAMEATRWTWENDTLSNYAYIVLYSAAGTFKKALPVQGSLEFTVNFMDGLARDALLFSPDSRKLVTNRLTMDLADPNKAHPLKTGIELIDVATGKSQGVYASDNPFCALAPSIVGWSDGSLLAKVYKGQEDLHKIALDGSSDEVIVKNCGFGLPMSSDGTLVADYAALVLTVKNQFTGKVIELAKDVQFGAWAPNSRMLLYSKKESIVDAVSKDRKRDFQSLWLSSLMPGKFNHMCVALDGGYYPSCSRDCRRIAYISQGQLYIAELTLREPRVDEKLAVGLPLTEDETKQVLMGNARAIGMVISMYAAGNEYKLPPPDSVFDTLRDRMNIRDDLFFRPGTQENIFKSIDPGVKTITDIKDPSSTVLGELDAGYSWKVQLYADGHVEAKAKQ